MSIPAKVERALRDTLRALARTGSLGEVDEAAVERAAFTVERPKRAEHGDFATNAAMVLAKAAKKPPRALAEALVAALSGDAVIRSAEVAGPGFVNLRLAPAVFQRTIAEILEGGRGYGRAPAATGERIDVEFVSANPTGPITIAATRNALYGDAVATLLEAAGHRVVREYYVNDYGNQIRLFGDSVAALAAGRDVPAEGYKGDYAKELAEYIKANHPAVLADPDRGALGRLCVSTMLGGIPGSKVLIGIRRSLALLGVHHDVWVSEESLHRWGRVSLALAKLEAGGYLVRRDGALFFVGKGADDDKDRVVRKSDGTTTYFASDIAYHADKVERGYDRLINVLGVDHHGYVSRIRNALEALGLPSERFEGLLYNLVYIYRDGEVVKSSKREGNVLTPEELCEEIDEAAGREGAGRDALRFFFLSRTANVNVEFDVELAKKKSLDNPVFYVQYGYARLSSILKNGAEIGFGAPQPGDLEALVHSDELALASKLGDYPNLVRDAAAAREPHKIAFYVQELAREFQSYYTRQKDDPVLPKKSTRDASGWEATWDMKKTRARLAWIEAIRVVYGSALALLGVSAPERMDRPEADDNDEDA